MHSYKGVVKKLKQQEYRMNFEETTNNISVTFVNKK